MKYFPKMDDKFMDFCKQLAKVLIKNTYTNEKICGSPENVRNIKWSHTLDTAPTHATEYNKKWFPQKNIDIKSTSSVVKIVKTHTNFMIV